VDVIVERCAALDVHKKTVMACVRAPDGAGGRSQELVEFRTFSRDLARLRDWLVDHGVSQVAMEATGVYWKPVWYVLESGPFELRLANARHVKNLPGRKTDACDAAWLCRLLECGLLRGSFVPPRDIGRLRDLTRYRTRTVAERGREAQRLQKLLEDAGIKLDSVATDIQGKSCRRMIEALIDGERDPEVLAEMAMTRMRAKIGDLREALVGRFDGHHALLARMHLDHMDELSRIEARLDEEVDRLMAPFVEAATHLLTIPGIDKRVAEVVVAEIGVDMSRFPTSAHLASWAGLCPGNHESAGKRRSGKARKGNAALRTALCEAAWAAGRTKDGYLPAQYRRFLRRFGKRNENKATFALAHTLIVIIWHVLSDGADYNDLGGDYFDRRNDATARQQYLVRELEKLGNSVALEPAA
jgi:transposase